MAITPGNHVSGSGASGYTTASIDTSGASLLVAILGYNGTGNGDVSDSKGNTWVGLTKQSSAGDRSARMFYVENPIVGTGHTFSSTAAISGLSVMAFNGTKTSGVFDTENGNATTTPAGPTISCGCITPAEDNELLVAGFNFCDTSGVPTIDLSYTRAESTPLVGGVSYGSALGYLIQTTAGARNPTWTEVSNGFLCGVHATFKSATASGNVIKTWDGLADTSVKTWNGLARASIKTFNGASGA